MKDTFTVGEAKASLGDLVRQIEQGNGPIWLARGRAKKAVLVDARMFEALISAIEDTEDYKALALARRTSAGSTLPMPLHARTTKTI